MAAGKQELRDERLRKGPKWADAGGTIRLRLGASGHVSNLGLSCIYFGVGMLRSKVERGSGRKREREREREREKETERDTRTDRQTHKQTDKGRGPTTSYA